ncbi:fumarylacetoacetate hydrolase family protein [Pusillimonas minor]|uniref:Fumarylacetoacetate hydrolase family protein n=1 Tax=Pusillimonas minor TaxID=2697024 RepID=A0A842HKQ4_9BURK|nr:fumarylacetoacetate hydrolase family protein [Pusillimonas minor]MBC2768823.1 fumarylacetoacetate hydrolase family protein [Pusillimonas minor]
MKYQVFTYCGPGGLLRPGIRVLDTHYDLQGLVLHGNASWSMVDDLLLDWGSAHERLSALAEAIACDADMFSDHVLDGAVRFSAPLTRCGVIYAAGANYRDHVEAMAQAMGMTLVLDPKKEGVPPWHFIKSGQSVLSAHQEGVEFPAHSKMLDWEAELAVVIGRRASRVSVSEALSYVAGYTCANDLSARDNLKREGVDVSSPFRFDWIGHKCFRGACPLGPYLTPAEFVTSPEDLSIKLWLNGELKQNSSTSNHLYSVADQISYLSQRLDLLPGDVILTGTPAGVGMEKGVFLKPGDVMRVQIEGLGELETTLV